MKYWEAEIEGIVFKAPTLKSLAYKLDIKPSLIEGVYYRSRLEDKIKIRKIVKEILKPEIKTTQDFSGNFLVSFD
jgi:hypothetical protein